MRLPAMLALTAPQEPVANASITKRTRPRAGRNFLTIPAETLFSLFAAKAYIIWAAQREKKKGVWRSSRHTPFRGQSDWNWST
jgi:hypothetical protein